MNDEIQLPPADIPPRTLVGYSSDTTVRPGDRIEFMVSSFDNAAFDADLVRVINGDGLSRYRQHSNPGGVFLF